MTYKLFKFINNMNFIHILIIDITYKLLIRDIKTSFANYEYECVLQFSNTDKLISITLKYYI